MGNILVDISFIILYERLAFECELFLYSMRGNKEQFEFDVFISISEFQIIKFVTVLTDRFNYKVLRF